MKKAAQKRIQKTGEFIEPRGKAKSVYSEFSRWQKRTPPPWHPVKKMRYVFFRMIAGCTITDALREISFMPSEFWFLIDIKKKTPFLEEYKRAKQLQGRSLGDAVVIIAEGRDSVTRLHRKRTDKIIAKAMHRIARSKSSIKSKMIFSSLMSDLREHDKIIMTRNKLQVDSTKWLAEKVNPAEFGPQTKMSLSGVSASPNNPDEEQKPIVIQFVGPDGKAVAI
jgi:hypothetical protein